MDEEKKTIVNNREPEEAEAGGAEDVSDVEVQEETAADAEEQAQTQQDEGSAPELGLPEGHPEMGELYERIEQRRTESRRNRRKSRTKLYVTITALVLLIAGLIFSLSGFFTVDSIEVSGNSRYTAEEIINMSHAVPGRNIIYQTDKSSITEYLEQNPYIKSASVTRRFPSTLVINVTERSESLAFRYDDDYLVMDENGILLRKTRNEPKTTLVEGIIVNKIKLGQKIGTEDAGRTDRLLDLIKQMNRSDLYFVRIDMNDEKKVKAYIYDTLVVQAGYETLIANLKNGRLHMVVEKLFDDGIRRGTITFDSNGTASFMPVI